MSVRVVSDDGDGWTCEGCGQRPATVRNLFHDHNGLALLAIYSIRIDGKELRLRVTNRNHDARIFRAAFVGPEDLDGGCE